MLNGFRLLVRRLVMTPGYSIAFILTLGLAIGINTAIFSVLDGVLLTPLPYTNSERLVYLQQPAQLRGITNGSFSFAEVQDYREAAHTVDAIVEYGDVTFSVVGEGEPHRAIGGVVTSNYFDVLGLRAELGRTLRPEDDGTDALPAMVLTHDYWLNAFGGDPSVIDKTVKLYAFNTPKEAHIVGVLRPGPLYTGSRRQDFFANYASNSHYGGASMLNERTHRMTDIFARLAPGQSVRSAQAELKSLSDGLHKQYPEAYPASFGYTVTVDSWREELTRQAKPTLLVLTGAVALVLLLACANVANLTLTRLVRRERELSVRAALGAGVTRLRLELLADNLVLATAGAVLGLALASASRSLLVQYASRFTVRTDEIGINTTVLLFTLLVSTAVAALLAWTPRLPGTGGLGSAAGAASSARGTAGLPRKQLQRGLVVSQLALCFTLLVGAGLMVRTLFNLSHVDPGLAYQSVVSVDVPTTGNRSMADNVAFMDNLTDRARHFPGVLNAAYTSRVPFTQTNLLRFAFRVEDREDGEVASPATTMTTVSPTYFQTVGIRILRGRSFNGSDVTGAEPVVIINQSLARRLFPAQEAVGRRLAQQQGNGQWGPWQRIVGVTADTHEQDMTLAETNMLFKPVAQAFPGQSIVLRTAGDASPALKQLSGLVRQIDPERPVDNIRTLEGLRYEDLAPPRLNATLFIAFGALALLIAAVGVFGVLSFTVSQRTREFGVRMAIGARKEQVLQMVLREGGVLVALALIAGGIGAFALSHFLSGLLFRVAPGDAVTYSVVGTSAGGRGIDGDVAAGPAGHAREPHRRPAHRLMPLGGRAPVPAAHAPAPVPGAGPASLRLPYGPFCQGRVRSRRTSDG